MPQPPLRAKGSRAGLEHILAVYESRTGVGRRRSRDRRGQAHLCRRTGGWCGDVTVATGPSEYLFGEETGLLEVLDGRPPLPRIAPPFRHGVDEVGSEPDEPAGTRMAEPGAARAPPTLVNNIETIAT